MIRIVPAHELQQVSEAEVAFVFGMVSSFRQVCDREFAQQAHIGTAVHAIELDQLWHRCICVIQRARPLVLINRRDN